MSLSGALRDESILIFSSGSTVSIPRVIEDLEQAQTETTGALPQLTDRERGQAVAAVKAPGPGRYLAVESGDEVEMIALTKPVTRIGRSLTADVRLEQAAVSRRHALIAERRGEALLLDDRSRNGTFLNGKRVSEAVLAHGDLIVLGDVRMRYVDVPA